MYRSPRFNAHPTKGKIAYRDVEQRSHVSIHERELRAENTARGWIRATCASQTPVSMTALESEMVSGFSPPPFSINKYEYIYTYIYIYIYI